MVFLLWRVLPSCLQGLITFGMTPCPTCTGWFLGSHFAIWSRAHPDGVLVSALYRVTLNLLTPLTALLSLLLSFLPGSGLFWRVCEVMEALPHLNCPVLSGELPHRFSASRGAHKVSLIAFQMKLFFLWQISQGSQTACLPSEQDLIWIWALKLFDFIQSCDAQPFREEQGGKVFHLRVWEGEMVMLMQMLTQRCRTGTVTSRNPQNSQLTC